MAKGLKVGDRIEARVNFMTDDYDADSAFPEDHPEWVDVRAGRRGTVVEATPHNELKVRWSHRSWVDGWLDGKYVKKLPTGARL